MKKLCLSFVLLITCIFTTVACGCNKEETIKKEDAIAVLKETNVNQNVEVVTTTETNVNGVKATSSQTDVYYGNKYYHSSETDGVSTKTWYGEINNVLYAFYYTKNANNEETKTSSRIDTTQLESAQKQPYSVVSNLFDENGLLLEGYEIGATKKGNTYNIQITSNLESESLVYTITIKDAKFTKIVKTSNIASDTITITYDYNYNVEDIELPTLTDYPLNVNS